MQIDKTTAVTAAAVAVAAMLPRWTPNRRALSLAMMSGARTLVDETRTPDVYPVMNVAGTDLNPEVEHLMNRTLSGVGAGTVVFLVSEASRLVIRDAFWRGVLVGGAYLLADAKYDEFLQQARAARAEQLVQDEVAQEHAQDPGTLDI